MRPFRGPGIGLRQEFCACTQSGNGGCVLDRLDRVSLPVGIALATDQPGLAHMRQWVG
ncbi:protein of unknown function [Bradyrhizobium vignae]|uniref:Uncharacterized protein n=1 Tax=Bradyrhizobium vignae TaxID=1549949 RepID=A0A2U3Q255_9BRAD|nr:protein of unknown function [Bradyrhizobium vignae]